MNNKYRHYKDVLAAFFQEHGYFVYGKSLPKKTTYLYSKDKQFPVIKIAIVKKEPTTGPDNEIQYLKNQVAEQKNTTPEVVASLEIYLSNNFEDNAVDNNGDLILISNNWDFLAEQLSGPYPEITNLPNPDDTIGSDKKLGESDFNLEEIKSADDLKKKVGLLNLQMKNGSSLGTMLIAALFLIGPIIIAITSVVLLGGLTGANNRGIGSLIFGGTTYSLTILGGQWWRIFTFGFGADGDIMSILFLFIFLWIGFRRLRLNELMLGTWKMLFIYLSAYLLTGFFSSVLSFGVVSGSSSIAIAIITGMIALNAGGSKTALAATAKNQLIAPIILMVIMGFIQGGWDNGGYSTVGMLIGFVAGGVMTFMVTYDYKELNWRLAIGVLILLILILVPVAMLIVPTYVPGSDATVLNSLANYLRLGWMNLNKVNSIIDQIGWNNVFINQEGAIIWISVQ